MSKLQAAIDETIKEAVEEAVSAVKYNISDVLGGLLYSLKLEMEEKGGTFCINDLVNIIIDSSRYEGPEGEEYPVWDKTNPQAKAIIRLIAETLQEHGIEQAPHFVPEEDP